MEQLKKYATDRQLEIIEAIEQHGSQAKAARALGISTRSLERSLERARKAAKRDDGDGYFVTGRSTLRNAQGDVVAEWTKTKIEQTNMLEMLEDFKEGLLQKIPKAKPIKAPQNNNKDLMACYLIGDHHFGMYAWGAETGESDWDTDRSRAVLMAALDKLVDRAGDAHTGLLVNVGDFFHANDTTSQTPASKHSLDTDGRFGRTIRLAGELFRYLIDRLLTKHKEIVIINSRGNHDPDAALWLNELVRAVYLNEKRVTVMDNFNKFVWYKFGKNLIVTHHGDRLKVQQAYEAITRNLPKEWGESEHRFLWMGHIHHKQQHEVGGLLAESFNVLAPPDYWHSASGYGASRSMTCIILHKDYGIDCRFQANIQELI